MLEVCALLNHQISFALLQTLAWSTGGMCRSVGLGHLSVYLQSQDLYQVDTGFSGEDTYSQHSRRACIGRLSLIRKTFISK